MSPNLRPRTMKKKMNSTTPKITSSPHQPPEESSNGFRSNKTSKVIAPDERLKKIIQKGSGSIRQCKKSSKGIETPRKDS